MKKVLPDKNFYRNIDLLSISVMLIATAICYIIVFPILRSIYNNNYPEVLDIAVLPFIIQTFALIIYFTIFILSTKIKNKIIPYKFKLIEVFIINFLFSVPILTNFFLYWSIYQYINNYPTGDYDPVNVTHTILIMIIFLIALLILSKLVRYERIKIVLSTTVKLIFISYFLFPILLICFLVIFSNRDTLVWFLTNKFN